MTPPLQPALRKYRPSDHDALVSLWSSCGLLRPWNDPRRDIERKLAHDPDGLLVLEADGCLAGSVMVGYDGHRGWVNYLAVDPAWQGRGLGRMLMDKAEERLLALGCPKVNLQIRTSNEHAVAFYRRLGYGTDDVVSMGKRLLADAAPGQQANSAGPRRAGPEAHRTPETGRFTSLAGIKRIPGESAGRTSPPPGHRFGVLTAESLELPHGPPGEMLSNSQILCISSGCSGLPGRLPGLVVVHDDVGVLGRAGRVEVELLGGYVAVTVASLDLGGGSERGLVSGPGAIQCLLERSGHEDAQVPPVNQFRAQEEHAVEEQHGVGGCRRDRLGQCRVGDFVVDRLLEPSVSARA